MSFVCNICSKAFTLKHNLTRHIASAHNNNKKYECMLCEKSFLRKDYLRDHRLSVHNKTTEVTCSKCGKTFARVYSMRRHQKICCRCKQCSKQFESVSSLKEHNCSKTKEVPNLFPNKETNFTNLDISEAFSRNEQATSSRDGVEAGSTRNEQTTSSRDGVEAGSIRNEQATLSKVNKQSKRKSLKIKRRAHQIEDEAAVPVECPAVKKKSKHQIMQEEEIEESDPNLKEFVKKYWSSIRSFIRNNKVQSIFNFYYNKDLKELIEKILEIILKQQKTRFKINYSLAYILKNIETEELRYFHASYNNHLMLKTALLISNRQELLDFLNSIAEENFIENITRPDTKWKIVQISNITFYVNHLQDAPLGGSVGLPDFIVNNRGLANVSAEDNLCFFRCLAVFRGADRHRCNRAAKQLFYEYCTHFENEKFSGVSLYDFVELENFYKINIVAYELENSKAKLIQRSRELHKETMKVNVFENHLSLIIDFEKYCSVYQCKHCDKLWYRNSDYYRHTKTCTTTVYESFPGGVYHNPHTIFEKLKQIGIHVPKQDCIYPYYACYDFEAYLCRDQLPENGPKLMFEARHVPMSVGIASNVPGFEEGKCFITSGDEKELIQNLIDYLEDISLSAYRLVKEKFRTTFEALESSDNIRKENLLKEFDSYCRELIVLGFNSSSYDLNLVKPILIERLLNEIDFVIKKANTYLCIKTSTLRFLDIKHFLAPGFSYRKFLIAYGSELEKFHFPYEFVESLEKLESDLPNHQAFYSSLTKSNITTEEYALVQKTWLEKRWKSLREMLVYYNLLDCVPFIQAVKNLLIPYKQQILDIFKRSFSVSGIAKLRMMQKIEKDSFFCLFPKKHSDLYKTLRSRLTGGLSIVFCRYAAAGETRIRSHEISNPETTEKILGLDANSLYLHAIAQNNPTGYFCRYKESENYRPDSCSRYGLMSYQWLSFMQQKEGNFIQSRYNIGERYVSKYSFKVDGFCQETNTIYEFDGCFWHGCDVCNANRNADGSLQETHPIKNISFSQIRKATQEKKQALTEEGFRVVSIRECEWLRMKKQSEIVSFLKTLKCVQPKYQLSFEKILKGIENKELYGFLIVDIHTPEDSKHFCRDFPPIIKNTNIGREDIGVYMEKVAEQHDLLKKPKKYLISSYFGKEILINTEMAEFYLNLGLKITRIYEFIQFHPEKCFEKLANEIVNSRREADLDNEN